ncbi:hypothetical protein ElyMa_006530700 [Elysia marginata]|uniref:Uncharacterized protein n=1 Tax=Elysia marginata TaxID=1093978 RepID=A0AAV4I6B6_9GAST|nr:hypothetical protein ElyMa_006530700 [Elysia marginata]
MNLTTLYYRFSCSSGGSDENETRIDACGLRTHLSCRSEKLGVTGFHIGLSFALVVIGDSFGSKVEIFGAIAFGLRCAHTSSQDPPATSSQDPPCGEGQGRQGRERKQLKQHDSVH